MIALADAELRQTSRVARQVGDAALLLENECYGFFKGHGALLVVAGVGPPIR